MSQVEAVRLDDNQSGGSMEADNVTPFPDAGARRDAARTTILAFTRDAAVVDTVRKAAPRDAIVIHASDLDQASDQLPSLQPQVLVLDAGCTPDVGGMTAQLMRQFPDMVIIVAGRREESAGLMKLTAAGQVYRVLLVPLALGQTRLTLEAALRRQVERSLEHVNPVEAGSPQPPTRDFKPYILGGVAALILLSVGAWFLLGSSDDSAEPAAVASNAAPGTTAAAVSPQVGTALAAAREAMAAEQYVEPAGRSALDHYRSALAIEPGNAEAQAGINTIADGYIERAEAAVLAERLDEAVVALELARNIKADHPRLTFLDSQLQRERERLQLTQAQEVNTRLRGLLTSASQRMESGRLLGTDSAREAFVEARRIDATDPAVIQGFRDLTARVLSEAEKAAAAGQAEQATALLTAARALSPSDARIAAIERSLTQPASATSPGTSPATAARQNIDSILALARTRMNEGRLLEPAGDSARDHMFAARAADAGNAQVQAQMLEFRAQLVTAGEAATAAEDFDLAGRLLSAANDLGLGADNRLAAAQRNFEQLRTEHEFRTNVVSAGSLNRTRAVAAEYPANAQRRNIEGWVDLVFTVTVQGTVTDVAVTGASPADVFNESAIRAVSAWRFEPVVRGGRAVPQRAATKLRFELQN